jgi:hypothetical protein
LPEGHVQLEGLDEEDEDEDGTSNIDHLQR